MPRFARHLPPSSARVADLARCCGLAKQSMAYLAEDLDRLGYVRIGPDAQDGRAKCVRLTMHGVRLVECLVAHGRRAEAALAERIGAGHVAALRCALEQAADGTPGASAVPEGGVVASRRRARRNNAASGA